MSQVAPILRRLPRKNKSKNLTFLPSQYFLCYLEIKISPEYITSMNVIILHNISAGI